MSAFMEFVAYYAWCVARDDAPRTIYHDRIDGLLLPACEPSRRIHR